MRTLSRISLLGLTAAMLIMASGCGNNLPTLADLNDSNIRRVHSVYKIYMNNNAMAGPRSQDELIAYVKNDNTARVLVGRMDLNPDTIEDIFVSERDGQPFKIRWGLRGIADHAIVFETEGVDGKRLVAFSKPRELDADEYAGYLEGKIQPESPNFGAPNFEEDAKADQATE